MPFGRTSWLLLALACPCTRAQCPIIEEAQRINHSVTSTSYSHHLVVDERSGVYQVDCSHFVGLILSHVSPEALKEIPKEPQFKYPRAFSFCDFFRGVERGDSHWTSIKRLGEAEPGDIIAWRIPELKRGKDTGHVAIIKSAPQRLDDDTYSIEVIDASEVRHFSDSRKDGETGIGTGVIQIKVNENGEPFQAKFNKKASWHSHLFGIGRLKAQ